MKNRIIILTLSLALFHSSHVFANSIDDEFLSNLTEAPIVGYCEQYFENAVGKIPDAPVCKCVSKTAMDTIGETAEVENFLKRFETGQATKMDQSLWLNFLKTCQSERTKNYE